MQRMKLPKKEAQKWLRPVNGMCNIVGLKSYDQLNYILFTSDAKAGAAIAAGIMAAIFPTSNFIDKEAAFIIDLAAPSNIKKNEK